MNSRTESFGHFLMALAISLCVSTQALAIGFSENPTEKNYSLLANVGFGLPGLDIDVEIISEIIRQEHYGYETKVLAEEQATTVQIAADLKSLSEQAGDKGSLLFFWTGHGDQEVIWPYDTFLEGMKITDLRDAIRDGRQNRGPLERLVLIFDACHSGSYVDDFRGPSQFIGFPKRPESFSINKLVETFTVHRNEYWKKLIILTSALPEEGCLASEEGSHFTLGLQKAYQETVETKGTFRDLTEKTIEYTEDSTPTFRFVPEALLDETLIPKEEED